MHSSRFSQANSFAWDNRSSSVSTVTLISPGISRSDSII
jgi:hypothetical protein